MRWSTIAVFLLAVVSSCGSETEILGPDWSFIVRIPSQPQDNAQRPITSEIVAICPSRNLEILISEGLTSAHSPSLSFDGKKLVFVGQQPTDVKSRLFTCDLDSMSIEALESLPETIQSPSFLPDGGVVYSGGDGLVTLGGDRAYPKRITFGDGYHENPLVLQDGRILFVATSTRGGEWRASDRLLTVHPDGTGVSTYAELPEGSFRIKGLRANRKGDVFVLALDRDRKQHLWRIDPDLPIEDGLTEISHAFPAVSGFDILDNTWFLACGETVVTVDEDLAVRQLVSAGGRVVDSVLISKSRPRPSLHLSLVDEARATADLFAIDVRRSRLIDVRDSSADIALVRLYCSSPETRRMRPIAEATVHEDGSFHVEVPADKPLWIDLIDRRGGVLARETHPFWVRPGERRGCIGCHEDRLSAAPNKALRALSAPLAEESENVGVTTVHAMESPQ